MSEFSLANLHFLNDIGDIEHLSLSNRDNTAKAADEISNQKANATTGTSANTLPSSSTVEYRNSVSGAQDKTANNGQLSSNNSSSSSVEVEFDENLSVLNEFEASETNSLRTVDYSYSENHADPNPAYQSVFTLSMAEVNDSIKTAEKNLIVNTGKRLENEQDEKKPRNGDYFDFDFDQTTFKARPYRPKSAVKRQVSFSIKNEETNQAKPNAVINRERLGPLGHNFWTEIEREVLQDENKESDTKEEASQSQIFDLKSSGSEDNESVRKGNDQSGVPERSEKSVSLSGESDTNDNLIRTGKESFKENFDETDTLNDTEKTDPERDFEDVSQSDASSVSKNDDDSGANERSIGILKELKSQIKQLLTFANKPDADDRLIDALNEIKQIFGQLNLTRKFEELKIELITQFSQVLANELNLRKQQERLELSEFKVQLVNLEERFDKQIKILEHNLLEYVKKCVGRLENDSGNEKQLEQQLTRLFGDLEKFKNIALDNAEERDRMMNELVLKLNLDQLSGSIESLSSKIDLVLMMKKEKKLTKNTKDAQSNKSVFSSDDEECWLDEVVRRDRNLNSKLEEIKLILNEMRDNQETVASKILNKDGDKNQDKVDFLEEISKKQTNELFSDQKRSTRTVRSELANQEDRLPETESKLQLEEQVYETTKCGLCEITNKISENMKSIHHNVFYRRKIQTYPRCSSTSEFLNRLDEQLKFENINTEHNHVLDDATKTMNNYLTSELEGRLNLRFRLSETKKDVRKSVKQLKQLGNHNFDANDPTSLVKLDDSHRLKQIQQMRFSIVRRLIKFNQMIVDHY